MAAQTEKQGAGEAGDESVQQLLNGLVHYYFKHAFSHMEKLQVHPGQMPLLRSLLLKNGQSQKELAEAMGIRPPTLTVMIQRMERNGLLCRKQDARDLRISRMELTEKGRAAANEMVAVMRETEALLLEGISESEILLLKRILRQMQTTLSKSTGNEG